MIPDYNPKSVWPPKEWLPIYRSYEQQDAWWSGDPERLAAFYGGLVSLPDVGKSFFAPELIGSMYQTHFWSRQVAEERRITVHVPVAGDIPQTSAALLFSEPPKCTVESRGTQERLIELVEKGNYRATLLESAEVAAALGGVFIKVDWDKELSPVPILSMAQPDQAIPEFKHGILTAVTFWQVVKEDDKVTWRLLEKHEPGWIYTELFKGTHDTIGSKEDLSTFPELPQQQAIVTKLEGLTCVYVPNRKPNRAFRNHPKGKDLGVADTAPLCGLMEALDESWSSLIRDIRLGVGRIIAPQSFFLKTTDGKLKFDIDKEVYTALNFTMSPGGALQDSIKISQFNIRSEEHLTTAAALLRTIYGLAGYAPQTFGLDIMGIVGSAESGSALTIRERKSLMTAAQKADYWKPATEYIFSVALQIDRLFLGGKATPEPVQVEMQDSIRGEISQIAPSVSLLSQAQVASKAILVKMLHPDWGAKEVEAEVKTILDESGLTLPEV